MTNSGRFFQLAGLSGVSGLERFPASCIAQRNFSERPVAAIRDIHMVEGTCRMGERRMASVVEQNRQLGLRINQEIWNNQRFDLIPELFAEDFVADYSPRVVRTGRDQIEQMIRRSHATFEGFKETVHQVIADENSVVLHFTISGKQVADWGAIAATNRRVKYDEIVIMQIRDGKVCRQVGVLDTLLALQQIGLIPDPEGLVDRSFE
jgi:predicted ester cyclase